MANHTPLNDSQPMRAATFNAPLQELDRAIQNVRTGAAPSSAPVISSYANSRHDHTSASKGGKLPIGALDSTGASAGQVPIADGTGNWSWGDYVEVPLGATLPFAGSAAPVGWLLCDGQAVSRTEYTDLFALIGTTFGVGDGSTTFGLPDLRGRAVAGLDNMGGSSADRVTSGSADSMGGSAGVARVTLDTTELPAHTHSRGGWAGSGDAGKSGGGSGVAVSPDPVTGSRGGDGSHNNMQPTFFLNWIIKA